MSIEEAIEKAIGESPERGFQESVDLAINLRDIDLSNPENRVDEEIVLPAGRGKKIKIIVIAEGEVAAQAEEVADVLRPDEVEELEEREAKDLAEETDFFLAETQHMQDVAKNLGSILGPRGKMPNPLTPEDDVKEEVKRLKGTIKLSSGDRRTFHAPVGTEEMEIEELTDNTETLLRRLESTLEKGRLNLDSVYVKTTMGPALEVI